MCNDCGCSTNELVSVQVQQSLLLRNDGTAAHNRRHFQKSGVLAINLMGSPGCGKTALLEATARRWPDPSRLSAVSGDLATDNDARRLARAGIAAKAITTGSACHLDAAMVHDALHDMAWSSSELLFIENVGNLVCPAIFDLGQGASVVAVAVTEGEDKPLKYPVMFRKADLVLLTKIDLLPHLPGFDEKEFQRSVASVCPNPQVLRVSAQSGAGMSEWVEWLQKRRD